MDISFVDVLNASISASWLVLAVVVLRLLLKKAPKAIHCALWALVAIRLLCPVSIESQFSLVPSAETVSDYYATQEAALNPSPAVLDVVENPIYPAEVEVTLDTASSRVEWFTFEWSLLWPMGMAVMAVYAAFSYLRLRRKVSASIPIARDIHICDYIDSPFILGILLPTIYLPSDMEQETVDHVLAHEKAHLARKDHWWKPLGFCLLTIHWFNPIMWLAYILLCRDIELACDEKVIKDLGADQKKAYSSALLRCSVSRPMIAACPLAFGEVGVKERVKTVLNYKKPAFWVIVLAVILCAVVAVCFLTDPMSLTVNDIVESGDYTILAQCDEYIDLKIDPAVLPEDIYSAEGHAYKENEVILYQTDTSTIWLRHVQYANEGDDKMYFEFDISHDLPKMGTCLYTYRITDENHYQNSFRIVPNPADSEAYANRDTDAFSIRGISPGGRFTVYVDTAYVQNLPDDYLTIGVCLNQLTYAKHGAEPEIPKVVHPYDPSYKTWAFYSDEIPEFDVGINADDRIAFYDPYAAFVRMTEEYAAAITYIQKTFALDPLTPLDYAGYKKYGMQVTTTEADLLADCNAVAQFLDIYENSFGVEEETARSAAEYSGTLKAGNIVAQSAMLSSGYGSADCIFTLDHGTLYVSDFNGETIFQSSEYLLKTSSREDLYDRMAELFVAYQDKEMVPLTEDFIPACEDGGMEICEFYDPGEASEPRYVIFFFNGEPTWFVEGNYQRFYEITSAMSEDSDSVDTYVCKEKVYWAPYSSLYVYDMEMEMSDNGLTVRFNDGEWSEGPFPLENGWQTECPIDETHLEILAVLSDLEPDFARRDLSGCRFMVVDATHFLVKKDGELYLVAWQASDIHLEIIQYIFHVVPKTESTWIPLGTATLETDPVEEAIRDKILNYHVPNLEANQIVVVSCDKVSGGSVMHGEEPVVTEWNLNVRLAQYGKESDGNIREVSFDYFTATVRYRIEDGNARITEYSQNALTELPDEAIRLEADCWKQAYAQFQVDTNAMLEALRQNHPGYFELSAENGIELYWQDTEEGIRCVIAPRTGQDKTQEELAALEPLTVPEAMLILGTYDAPSSYYRIADDENAVVVVVP